MNKIMRVAALLVMALSVFAFVPGGAMAQQAGRETVSIQVDVTLPSGVSVVGTLVARRECGLRLLLT